VSAIETSGETAVVGSLLQSGAVDRLAGTALREVAPALGHVELAFVSVLFRVGLPVPTPDLINTLAEILAQQMHSGGDEARNVTATLSSLRGGALPKLPDSAAVWRNWLIRVPAVELGRAVAQLIPQRAPQGTCCWSVPKGRFRRGSRSTCRRYLREYASLRRVDASATRPEA
jgi:hypothetical protein